MGFDLAARRNAITPLTIDVDGDPLNIRYKIVHLTPSKVAELIAKEAAATKKKRRGRAAAAPAKMPTAESVFSGLETVTDYLVNQFLETVVDWDLLNDGKAVPLTREGLAEADVDFDMMAFVLNHIKDNEAANTAKTPTTQSASGGK